MQFRCYRCGFKFHDGLPPVEALSDVQVDAVFDVSDPNVQAMMILRKHTNPLRGTKFEGMSPHSFCGFCILIITEFPSAIEAKWDLEEAPPRYRNTQYGDVFRNRQGMYSTAEFYYRQAKDDMVGLLQHLLTSDFPEFKQVFCGFPDCTESVWWTENMNLHTYRCEAHPNKSADKVCSVCRGPNYNLDPSCYRCAVGENISFTLVRHGWYVDHEHNYVGIEVGLDSDGFEETRCFCCGWPYAPSGDCGCTLGGCSFDKCYHEDNN